MDAKGLPEQDVKSGESWVSMTHSKEEVTRLQKVTRILETVSWMKE